MLSIFLLISEFLSFAILLSDHFGKTARKFMILNLARIVGYPPKNDHQSSFYFWRKTHPSKNSSFKKPILLGTSILNPVIKRHHNWASGCEGQRMAISVAAPLQSQREISVILIDLSLSHYFVLTTSSSSNWKLTFLLTSYHSLTAISLI